MVGEFGVSQSPQRAQRNDVRGSEYAMVVNLSLETTTQVMIKTVGNRSLKIVSAVDRSFSNYDPKNGIWLNAGQGFLLKL
jgi:hypothetical protein